MSNTAIVFAGVPSTIHSQVLTALRAHYSTGYVFRVTSSPSHKDGQAHYTTQEVDAILESSRDAIFGENKRPSSFCRNSSQQCSINHNNGKRCSLESGQSCSLKKPDNFILLYQPGESSKKIQSALHYSALILPLTDDCYGHAAKTVAAAIEAISLGMSAVKQISDNMTSLNSPYLLPPINYGMGIEKLFKIDADATKQQKKAKAFRVEKFAGDARAYKGKAN